MATGVNKSELYGEEALLASRPHLEPFPLPGSDCNVMLSYPGKVSEQRILEKPELSFLKYSNEGFVPSAFFEDDSFSLCDNYFGLHQLISQGKKATLIYLDPPYGTGLNFQSRGLKHAYKDDMSSAAYIEYMRRRLILMREVLSDDGSIYVHIGHQMVAQIKLLMDEIFGANNFRNLITRKKCSSKNFTKKQFSNVNDYVIFYTKSSSYKWNKPGLSPSSEWIDKEYPKIDEKGRYKLVPVHAPGKRNGETGKAWRGILPPPGKHWQYSPAKLDDLDSSGEIHWSRNGNPRRKVYLTTDKKISYSDYWDCFRDAHHQSIKITGYPTEKNFDMLKMIVGASSDEGDLVLDPFCGSGTALHAARDLRRKWIGFDQSLSAASSVINRLSRGVDKMGDYVGNGRSDSSQFSLVEDAFSHDEFNVYVDGWLLGEGEAGDLDFENIFC